jgi:L-threonylcarbamoyladenylate synthase
VALELLRQAGVPVAAPSANRFTGISPTTAEHVQAAFGDAVDVVDGGPTEVGIESTVVAVDGEVLTLLRPGMVSLGDLETVTARASAAHPAPGMHVRHYSPRTPLKIVTEAPEGSGAYLWLTKPGSASRPVRMPGDPSGYAARLYAALHELDQEGLPWIAVEAPPETPEWAAIRDRLRRAEGTRS